MDPVLTRLCAEYEQVKFLRVDVESNEDIANNEGVQDLPLYLFFK